MQTVKSIAGIRRAGGVVGGFRRSGNRCVIFGDEGRQGGIGLLCAGTALQTIL
ncbi:MAG: hypothetical protein LBU21_05740 [Treponema sp.]|jgi:hypothetical protein|nr:hypothetical protein [Treponema sp.]